MLLGVLDIGSNSAQLQVFEVRPGAPPLPTHAVKEPTLLGEAFDPDGAIDHGGIDRVIMAVNRAMNAARRLGVQQLYVFTTSAVRDVCPWALREGIVLHYLQTTHNQSFDLPLRPLPGIAYQEDRPRLQVGGRGALVAAPAPARR
jgi:exopolyphosphatase/pppGpp-phosphohydrolase